MNATIEELKAVCIATVFASRSGDGGHKRIECRVRWMGGDINEVLYRVSTGCPLTTVLETSDLSEALECYEVTP